MLRFLWYRFHRQLHPARRLGLPLALWLATRPRSAHAAHTVSPITDQNAYRGFEDDAGLGSATPKAALNTGWTQDTDVNFRVRFEIEETAGASPAYSLDSKLQYRRNGGTWFNVDGSSSGVRSAASPHAADGAFTANDLAASGLFFSAGRFDDNDGLAMIGQSLSNTHTEHEYCVQIRSALVADGDLIELRVIDNDTGGLLTTYSQVPQITANVPAAGLTLDLGKVASGQAVRGVNLSAAGPDTLSLGKIASDELVRGVDLDVAGPLSLLLGKVLSAELVRGVNLGTTPTILELGKVASEELLRGIDLSAAGPITLGLGKVASGELLRGVNLSAAGPDTLSLGKIASGELVRGIDLAGSVLTLSLGKVASDEVLRGIDLSQSGPVTLSLGKIPSGELLRGIDLSVDGSGLVLSLGKVPSGELLRGLNLSQSGPVTLLLGKVAGAELVRGLGLLLGGPIALELGKVSSSELLRGLTLSQSGPVSLLLGRIPSAAVVRGITFNAEGHPARVFAVVEFAGQTAIVEFSLDAVVDEFESPLSEVVEYPSTVRLVEYDFPIVAVEYP